MKCITKQTSTAKVHFNLVDFVVWSNMGRVRQQRGHHSSDVTKTAQRDKESVSVEQVPDLTELRQEMAGADISDLHLGLVSSSVAKLEMRKIML